MVMGHNKGTKGHRRTFWGSVKVLYLDQCGGYTVYTHIHKSHQPVCALHVNFIVCKLYFNKFFKSELIFPSICLSLSWILTSDKLTRLKTIKVLLIFLLFFIFQILLVIGPVNFPFEISPFVITFSPVLYTYCFHLPCTDKSRGRVGERREGRCVCVLRENLQQWILLFWEGRWHVRFILKLCAVYLLFATNAKAEWYGD